MAFHRWTLFLSALILLALGIGTLALQSCGSALDKTYGVFTSPNYPNVYDMNFKCSYKIWLPTNSSITINFETFELDRSPNDSVLITCASNSSYRNTTYTWSSNIVPICFPWCSIGRIDFVSDNVRPFSTRGFKVHYQVNTISCGNTVFVSSSGTISSPNFPRNYNKADNCTYSIWAPTSSSFSLSFEAFRVGLDCRYQWVQISCDNPRYISPKYCGSSLPRPTHIGSCTNVLIWFHTSNSMVYIGFSLRYSYTSNDPITTPMPAFPISDQGQSDPDVGVTVLAVLLAICLLGLIGIAVCFTVRRYTKQPREEEGQRSTNQDTFPLNNSVDTPTPGSECPDLPVLVYSPESAITSPRRTVECHSEQLNDGYDEPPSYDTIYMYSSSTPRRVPEEYGGDARQRSDI